MKVILCSIALFCALSSIVFSQGTPFKASQGIPTATTSAKSSGLPNAKLTSIATLGDTTFFGAYLPSLIKGSVKFDPNNGTASFWGYNFHDTKNGVDTSTAVVVLKVITYLPVQTTLPDIPNLPIRLDSPLPSSFMDSDTMAAKITRNKLYGTYLAAHPAAKFQAIALGMSNGSVGINGPLWIAFVGDKTSNPSLECYVPAADNSGAAICIDVPVSDAVEDQPSEDRISLYPNPALQGRMHLHIPLVCYQPQLSLEVHDLLGNIVQRRGIETIGGGVDVELDLHELSGGMYFVNVNGTTQHVVLPVILEP